MRILEHNTALNSYRYVSAVPDPARLARTRSFVVYLSETVQDRDEYGRPCHKVIREEIARGQA